MIGSKFPQIDALRFIAVFAVLLSHWHIFDISESTAFMLGSNGVNLFFAISGFLITLGLLRSKETDQRTSILLRNFYIRRFLRIFPIYYLMLILLWFFNHPRVADGMPWYLSYLTNFYCIKIKGWGGLSHLWSLAIEEQFYLIWPFIILLVPRQKTALAIILVVFISVLIKVYWVYYTKADFWTMYMNPLAVADTLGLGALLAYLHQYYHERLKHLVNNPFFIAIIILQLAALIICKNTLVYGNIYQVFYRISFGLFYIILIGKATYGFKGLLGDLLNLKSIRYVGKVSYGIYLFHIIVPGMFMGLKYPPDDTLLRFCLYLIVTITISSVSWKYFENPILKLKSKFE